MKQFFLAVALLASGCCASVQAQTYPSRQVTIVVPVAAGGAVDYVARLIAGRLADRLGKPFVVENRPGAGMINGTVAVAKAAPDGHTLVMGSSTSHAINATLYKKLPYDPTTDFVPVAHFANSPFMLVVHPDLPVKSIGDLVAYARTKSLSYASAGPGTPHHLFAELLKTEMNIEMTHVPYRGNVPAITDVVAGHIPLMFSDPSGVPLIRDGKVRALGVSSSARVAVLPDLPPLSEVGLPGFDAVAWLVLFAPAGTPRDIIDELNSEIRIFSALPDTKALISKNAQIPVETPPIDALRQFVQSENARWGKVVQQAGIAGSQ